MLHIRKDPTGSIARLECDGCGRKSTLFLAGDRMSNPASVLDWLRKYGRSMGWGQCPSLSDDGQEVQIDLCSRCARKLRRFL